jgi:hypothetical protein
VRQAFSIQECRRSLGCGNVATQFSELVGQGLDGGSDGGTDG